MNQPKWKIPEPQMESFHYEPDIKSRKPGVKRVAAYCRVSTLMNSRSFLLIRSAVSMSN